MSSSSSVQLLQHYLSVFKPRVSGKETDASVEIQLHEQIVGGVCSDWVLFYFIVEGVKLSLYWKSYLCDH